MSVSLPSSFDDLNYLVDIQAQPSAAFAAFNFGNRVAILNGSDLSVARSKKLTAKQTIQSIYTDDTMNSRVIATLRFRSSAAETKIFNGFLSDDKFWN